MVDRRDVRVEFLKAGGPGGQHRNKTETGVRLTHRPTGVVVRAVERRSRRQNLEVAFERLEARLERLRARPAVRRRTRPTAAARERRLAQKRRRSRLREERSRPDWP